MCVGERSLPSTLSGIIRKLDVRCATTSAAVVQRRRFRATRVAPRSLAPWLTGAPRSPSQALPKAGSPAWYVWPRRSHRPTAIHPSLHVDSAMEVDKVEIYKSFRPGDVVRAEACGFTPAPIAPRTDAWTRPCCRSRHHHRHCRTFAPCRGLRQPGDIIGRQAVVLFVHRQESSRGCARHECRRRSVHWQFIGMAVLALRWQWPDCSCA